MQISKLYNLLVVAESQSISTAAQKLFISQSSLSSMIKSVEEELGVTIFRRTAKGVLPTEEGALLLRFARDVTNKYDELIQQLAVRHPHAMEAALVTYACASDFMSMELTRSLRQAYPNAALTVYERPESQIMRSVMDGLANIGIGFVPADSLNGYRTIAEKNGLEMEPLYIDRVCLLVGGDSPYAQRSSVHVQELEKETLAVSHCCMENVRRSTAGRTISSVMCFGNLGLVKKAVAQNGLIACLPGLALRNEPLLQSGAICKIPLEGIRSRHCNCCFYPKGMELSRLERSVLETIRGFFSRLPPP